MGESIHAERIQQAIQRAVRLVAPPPKLTVSQWADRNRYLSREVASEPGKWRTDRVPYLRAIMDAMTDPTIERIVVMKAARMGATECINNAIGYFIEYDPCPILYVQQTIELGERYSKKILAPMIRDTPALATRVAEPRSRDSNSTILDKVFPGGDLTIVGANSPRGFRMVSKRVVICDDIDGFESNAGDEGDPVDLSIRRADTFSNRKIILISSPTIKGCSRIEAAFEDSDQRYFLVPCPSCGKYQRLIWGQLKFESKDPQATRYECEHCRTLIPNHAKGAMLRGGRWEATAPFRNTAGFHISKLYSPWVPWPAFVEEFLKAKKHPETLKVWVNTGLGETWDAQGGEGIDVDPLYARREHYGPTVPAGGLVLTAGVDCQGDRLEVEVVAWGRGEESWSMAYRVFHGSPAQPEVWADLDRCLSETYTQEESGLTLRLSCTCVDTGGHFAQQAYAFVRPRQVRRIFAVKGINQPGRPLVGRPSINNLGKVKLFPVGVDTAKDLLFGRLRIQDPGPGYLHFPFHYSAEFFQQLTAEKAVTRYHKGFPMRSWVKIRARNEALDCRVYAMAALGILNVNLDQLAQQWDVKAGKIGQTLTAAPARRGRRVIYRGMEEVKDLW